MTHDAVFASTGHLSEARKVADAILYEGYLLYPYHGGAQKNRSRFQFGVLMPPGYAAIDPSEPHRSQTECLLECADGAQVLVTVRFLQVEHRSTWAAIDGTGEMRQVASLTVGETEHTTWDEAAERELQVCAQIDELLSGDLGLTLHVPAGERATDLRDSAGRLAGREVRTWTTLDGVIRLRAHRVVGPYGAIRLTVAVENHSAGVSKHSAPAAAPACRDEALASALIAAHALIWVPGGSFLSMTDPPEWAAAEVAACENIGTWPVLAGPEGCEDLMLSAPVILYDHAQVAPESAGDMFDATEIDEILTLRTLALTDGEKNAARSTDPRAAGLMDRLDTMPQEMLDRLHGAIRYLRAAPAAPAPGQRSPGRANTGSGLTGSGPPRSHSAQLVPQAREAGPADPFQPEPGVPWWDPGADTSVSPETDQVIVAGVPVARGSLVLMRPGARRADAQDLFLAGRVATVEAVLHDVDGNVHVAVCPADDPAADLHRSHGRFLYFGTDEIEPVS